MAKQKSEYRLPGIALHPDKKQPLYKQLYESVRKAILDQRLQPGEKLPPSRELAQQFGISRTTVLLAFDHLLAEGYIEGKTGSGTYVSNVIPDELFRPGQAKWEKKAIPEERPELSDRGALIRTTAKRLANKSETIQPFRPGIPALRSFPYEKWVKLMAKTSRSLAAEDFGYGEPEGFVPLRKTIADYLRTSRAVRCKANQVIIVSSTQQAIYLACQILMDPGDQIWQEDPGYLGSREAMQSSGLNVIPVPVDEEGLNVEKGIASAPDAKMVYVTPSHQYPVGVTMSLNRRLQLLEWAAKNGAWILEDDYDSEYRFEGRPLSSLQGIDHSNRVVYMGTFSKVLFPGLRVAYMVVPEGLAEAFAIAKAVSSRDVSILEQATVHQFIKGGHFGRHLRQMRILYQQRQQVLIGEVREKLSSWIDLRPNQAGLHLAGWFKNENENDILWSERFLEAGLVTPPISRHYLSGNTWPGLVIAFAPYTKGEIIESVEKMKKVFEKYS